MHIIITVSGSGGARTLHRWGSHPCRYWWETNTMSGVFSLFLTFSKLEECFSDMFSISHLGFVWYSHCGYKNQWRNMRKIKTHFWYYIWELGIGQLIIHIFLTLSTAEIVCICILYSLGFWDSVSVNLSRRNSLSKSHLQREWVDSKVTHYLQLSSVWEVDLYY